jgi:hypothetical protein
MKEIKNIRWIDSTLQDGQVDHRYFPKPSIITTVGFVVDETDEYITFARDDMGDGDFRGLCCIPKLAILED